MILDSDTPLSNYGIDDQLGCNFQLNWTNYGYWSSVFQEKIGEQSFRFTYTFKVVQKRTYGTDACPWRTNLERVNTYEMASAFVVGEDWEDRLHMRPLDVRHTGNERNFLSSEN